MSKLFTIKKRKEFLRVANKGYKMVTSTIILQAAQSLSSQNSTFTIGFTATKKIGPATARNKTKRRMRAASRELHQFFLPKTNYVLIGRHNTADCDYRILLKDLKWGLKKINQLLEADQNAKAPDPNPNSAG